MNCSISMSVVVAICALPNNFTVKIIFSKGFV